MIKTTPVVFGNEPPMKGSPMSLGNSRYLKPRPKKNTWREHIISESNLIVALEYALRQSTHLKPSEKIEKVIVGEPHSGQYPLSVSIIKVKED